MSATRSRILERPERVTGAPNRRDLFVVGEDHRNIIGWVLNCHSTNIENLPIPVQIKLALPSEKLWGGGGPIYEELIDENIPEFRISIPQEEALLQLSESIAEQRLSLSYKAQDAYNRLQFFTLLSIGIGMATTILVSLSATEIGREAGRTQSVVRVLAIVFPAIGTAAAAINAFYTPQAIWAQSSRTLASQTQLHGQMSLAVWSLDCPKQSKDKASLDLQKLLDQWSTRFNDIQTIASASSSSASVQTPAPGNQNDDGSKNPPPASDPMAKR